MGGTLQQKQRSASSLVLHNLDPRTYVGPTFCAYSTLALAVYYGGLHAPWPASASASAFGLAAYAVPMLLRNALLTFSVYSLWYYLLYERVPPISKAKLNTRAWHVPDEQLRFEQWHTMVGSGVASLAELACAALAEPEKGMTGAGSWSWRQPASTCGLALAGALFSDYHFWAAHRVLHPWFARSARADPGRVLYRLVHSLHHRAVSPNPWSGLSMHWFEHLLYFSRAPAFLLLVRALSGGAVRVPPAVYLFVNIRAMLGPAPGHHGFENCMGSRFHYYHHVYNNVNFGTRPSDGMDWLCGTLREEG
eukprot:g8131.t1